MKCQTLHFQLFYASRMLNKEVTAIKTFTDIPIHKRVKMEIRLTLVHIRWEHWNGKITPPLLGSECWTGTGKKKLPGWDGDGHPRKGQLYHCTRQHRLFH